MGIFILFSCGNNPNKPIDDTTPKKESLSDSIVGEWITTAEETTGEVSDTMGVKLMKGGKAESINMPTYQYQEWKTSKDTIVMKALSKATGMPDTTIADTGIVDLKSNTITLQGSDVVYRRK